MKFHEEMEKAFLLSHSADALERREEPEGHDYSSAEVYLTHIKEAIRGQLRTAPEAHAEGHVILGSLPLEEGPGTTTGWSPAKGPSNSSVSKIVRD